MTRRLARLPIAAALAAAALATPAFAADAPQCKTVRMSDPGWTDITSTNALLGQMLKPLGYTQKVDTLAVPVTFEALKNGQLDVFLGNWMPAQTRFVEPLVAAGDLVVLNENLSGIRFTLAVPSYVAEAGVTSFNALAANADKFDHKIYGIEPGSAANQNLQKMLDAKDYGLDGWQLVESSEQAMLGQVSRATSRKEWVVFLAWEPHPMNTVVELTYLADGDKTFGPNYGASSVHSVSRKGFAADCPNLAKLVTQMVFAVGMENEIMGKILQDGEAAEAAAGAWLKAHPEVVGPWLSGVTTFDGGDGPAAVKAALGL